ncbi:manganese superoxide dismutase [Echria macrotheca]|uniref:Superoxide dismutase n=1 Tax=Echria macrotheca TaxID=438768 RepID=A0AAJ0B9L7_9PEZI|nr:manganese superoxide dismutase [Echria macrotheca]
MVNLGTLVQYLALQGGPQQQQQQILSGDQFNMSLITETTYTLPSLPYAYDALEPHISSQIMTLHHDKHHQAYVDGLNAALKGLVAAVKANDLPAQIALQPRIRFHGGGHINHALFWANLAPAGSEETNADKVAGGLVSAIEGVWGSMEGFRKEFGAALVGIQGSGWGWLVKDGQTLKIVTTKDQDPIVGGEVPIFGVDMWEHAYYLQYLNVKAKYVENIWNVINWKTAEERFLGERDDVFEALRAALKF